MVKNFFTKGWGIKSLVLSSLVSVGLLAYEKLRDKPDLQVHVESVENIIDLKEDMADLQVLYKNKPLIRDGQTIKIAQIKLENFGKSILNEHYEMSRDFYFLLDNSVVLTLGSIESNEKYLSNSIFCPGSAISKGQISDSDIEKPPSRICLSKVIFDSDKFVRFKVYVLQNIKDKFSISLKGKISGISEDDFQVTYPAPPVTEEDGGFFGSLKKFGKYLGIVYLTIFAVTIPLVLISDHLSKKRRRKNIAHFLSKYPNENYPRSPFINFYIERGLTNNVRILVDEIIVKGSSFVPIERFFTHRDRDDGFKVIFFSASSVQRISISSLVEAGLIEIKEGKVFLNKEFSDLLSDFVKFGTDLKMNFEPTIEIPPFI